MGPWLSSLAWCFLLTGLARSQELDTQSEYPARPATDGRQLFLLLTTQRSGSTWTCQVLSAQRNVSCGIPKNESVTGSLAELLMQFTVDRFGNLWKKKRAASTLTFGEWRDAADKAFDAVAAASPSGASGAIGWKLMYNQVPDHLIDEVARWISRRRIAVIHLVREASVLRLASLEQASKQAVHHVTDPRRAQALASGATPVALPDSVARQVRELERVDGAWRALLERGLRNRESEARYRYVAYEELVGARSHDALTGAVRFLTGVDPGTSVSLPEHHQLQQIHDGRCSHRIKDWEHLRSVLENTRTAEACDALEQLDAVFRNATSIKGRP